MINRNNKMLSNPYLPAPKSHMNIMTTISDVKIFSYPVETQATTLPPHVKLFDIAKL